MAKRPSMQWYPTDYRNNANLRRCGWAARGAWVEILGLMHDSDEYGILRWTLKEIANGVGCPLSLVQELFDKGVLKGSGKGICEPYIYTPRSGRKDGAPVTLVAAQAGPIWYSSRMVKDEYVRSIRGGDTRFDADNGATPITPPKNTPKSSPKGGIGEGFGVGKSDGPSISSSSSSSNISVESSDSVVVVVPFPTSSGPPTTTTTTEPFPMHRDWKPDDTERFYDDMFESGIMISEQRCTEELLEFRMYWRSRSEVKFNQAGWESQFLKRLKELWERVRKIEDEKFGA